MVVTVFEFNIKLPLRLLLTQLCVFKIGKFMLKFYLLFGACLGLTNININIYSRQDDLHCYPAFIAQHFIQSISVVPDHCLSIIHFINLRSINQYELTIQAQLENFFEFIMCKWCILVDSRVSKLNFSFRPNTQYWCRQKSQKRL